MRTFVTSACVVGLLAVGPSAWGQSSSLLHRDQPTRWLWLPQQPGGQPGGQPGQSPMSGINGPAPVNGSSQGPALPGVMPARSSGGEVQPYSPTVGVTREPNVSPAVGALQRASFTAIAPPTPKQYQLHDLVTIIVREETSYNSNGKSELDKTYSFDAKIDKWLKFHAARGGLRMVPETFPDFDAAPEIKISGKRSFDGEGKNNRKDTFIGRLTAEIIDIKPNGTMVLSARRSIVMDNETQCFELSGTCRLEDVNADNTVLSTQLADVTVRKKTGGQVRDAMQRGLVPWLLDKLQLF